MDDRSPLRLIWLLLLVPYVGLLWVPFYNARTPELWGFPFFYWYQLIWVPITAALTWLVYRSARHDDYRDFSLSAVTPPSRRTADRNRQGCRQPAKPRLGEFGGILDRGGCIGEPFPLSLGEPAVFANRG